MRLPSRRALAVATGSIVAVAFVALAAAGGDDASGDRLPAASSASTTTTTTERRATTTTSTTENGTSPSAPSTTNPPIDFVAEPIGERRAVFITQTETVVLRLDTDETRTAPHDERLSANYGSPLFVSGDAIFFFSRRQVFVTSLSNPAPLRSVGAGLLMLSSSTPGRVWVARERGTGYVLDEIDVTGATMRTSRPLPADVSPRDVAGDRVVFQTPEGAITVWDLVEGRVTWSSPPASNVLAVGGGRVVWQRACDSPLCVLHVTDLDTGRDRTIPAVTDGTEFYPDIQAISPSGRYLAAMVGTGDGGPAPFKLRLIDLDSGLVSEEDAFEPARVMWSPDERWLFVGGDGNPSRPLRWAYRVDGLDLHSVRVNVPSNGEALAVAVA